jgi:hypothetical protein
LIDTVPEYGRQGDLILLIASIARQRIELKMVTQGQKDSRGCCSTLINRCPSRDAFREVESVSGKLGHMRMPGDCYHA